VCKYLALTPYLPDSFVYDELGNRQGDNHVASRGQTMTMMRRDDNRLNQYQSWENDHPAPDPLHWGSRIFYDDNPNFVVPVPPSPPPANGVMMADGYITASYNALNQPVGMWSTVYNGTSNFMWFGYDPLGRCVKRWKGPASAGTPGYNPATYFYYDGSNMIQEGPSASVADRTYVHGGGVDEIVASQVSGVWYNHLYDGQGNCILLSTASGGLQEQYDYDAFGYPYFYTAAGGKAGNVKTRFLFTGREWISDMRIYDYRARQYQPELGRFLEPDPKEFEAGDYNLYRYCHNDPVNKSDPTGLTDAERILQDRQWKMNCFFDSGNSFQGSSAEFMARTGLGTGTGPIANLSGNYKDPDITHHIKDQTNPGDTVYTNSPGDGQVSKPTLNWWVKPGYEGTEVVLGELEHVSRYMWASTDGDLGPASSRFNANPNAPYAKEKLENARLVKKLGTSKTSITKIATAT
jgi:RHS repeat-associated protein